jgi:hypothetical protein
LLMLKVAIFIALLSDRGAQATSLRTLLHSLGGHSHPLLSP